ncbi:uncharacterized protein LOC111431168 [Cucurbita moschata]|uniref:Uncharacterized protein LOC111431168 n=1 Tax=Cucurbita moschata TaxID=3662 RepID=A0A6J1E9T1_CUCMO|nr:uncharacterized protein LOC111431168 [Cucurbita moschata]
MTLNCLSCQLLQRTDSERDPDPQHQNYYSVQIEPSGRSWSALPEDQAPPVAPRRLHSSGPISLGSKEPKLVRSSGMRRDWSFEDLRAIREEK